MEFNEKLQELRRKRGLTQEELAGSLYVSRTAISKWESGRGYPSIESLRAIAQFFSVTVDELLSSDEALTLAEEDGKEKTKGILDMIIGLLDISVILLLFIPLFAVRGDETLKAVSLIAVSGIRLYLKISFIALAIGIAVTGVLTLALQSVQCKFWTEYKTKLSLVLSIAAVLIFTLSLQPYAAVFTLSLLIIKVITLVKRG